MRAMPSRHDALLHRGLRRSRGQRRRLPFLERVLRGRELPRREAADVVSALPALRRSQPDQRPVSCPRRGGARRARITTGRACRSTGATATGTPFWSTRLRQMAGDGVRRALAFVTSAFGSYSGCRQYLEDIERARAAVGEQAPVVDKLRGFHNHPGLVEAARRVRDGGSRAPARGAPREPRGWPSRRTASRARWRPPLPTRRSCARPPGSSLRRSGGRAGVSSTRAGADRPSSRGSSRTSATICGPWPKAAPEDVVVAPIGFVSDHMEVVYDLDLEAKGRAVDLGLDDGEGADRRHAPAVRAHDPRASRGADVQLLGASLPGDEWRGAGRVPIGMLSSGPRRRFVRCVPEP